MPCLMEFRRTIFSDQSQIKVFEPGMTLAEMMNQFEHVPREFRSHGAIVLFDPKTGDYDWRGMPVGVTIYPHMFDRVRPHDGVAIFASTVPHGGMGGGGGEGAGGGGKSTFALVAAIAITAMTIWMGPGGGLALLSSSVFGVTLTATQAAIGAAAIGVAASAGLAFLTQPEVGNTAAAPSVGGSGKTTSLGAAGISQNPIGAYQQVPAVLGTIRVSPPLLARPYTISIDNSEWVYLVAGIVGPCAISDIKVNDLSISDLPTASYEYEVREGWDNDEPLTIVNQCVFQENINTELSGHVLEDDQKTLVQPITASYPQGHVLRTARECDTFRISLLFPTYTRDNGDKILSAFRIRMKQRGTGTWYNFPELILTGQIRNEFRQEIWFHFGDPLYEEDVYAPIVGQSQYFNYRYAKNSEWTAETYFIQNASLSLDPNPLHTYVGKDGVHFYLDKSIYPIDQWDFEITQSSGVAVGGAGTYNDVTYSGGLFTYTTTGLYNSVTREQINNQSTIHSRGYIRHYTSFRNRYPIGQRNVALICAKIKNIEVKSISAVFSSYVDEDSIETTRNPADLYRMILVDRRKNRGKLIDESSIEDLSEWKQHCEDLGLTCDAVVSDGSIEKALSLVSACGDAIPRRSDKWGVVVDKDRSAEPIAAMFHQGNMISPLVRMKALDLGSRAIVPSFTDIENDYTRIELDSPIYDDNVVSGVDGVRIDAVPFEGYVDEDNVRRRAKLDLRRSSTRDIKYQWGADVISLNIKKGSIVGIAHDTLAHTFAGGRVRSVTGAVGAQITKITMNTDVLDVPEAGFGDFFAVEPDVFTMSNLFWDSTYAIKGPDIGATVELSDNTYLTFQVSSITGPELTLPVSPSILNPGTLLPGALIAVGLLNHETKRVILTNILPRPGLTAICEGVDAADSIHEDL
jgi:hypothetical protein